MAKFALVTEDNGDPVIVFLEDAGAVRAVGPWADGYQERIKFMKITTAKDAVASGFSYYSVEVGQYAGKDKQRIDAIIQKWDQESA